jgi:hypothetical protein
MKTKKPSIRALEMRLKKMRTQAVAAVTGAMEAYDEVAAEYVRKKRVADWKKVNEGLVVAETFLREVAK